MNLEATTPATGAATETTSANISTVHKLRAPYQIRCLKALLLAPVDRSDLDRAIGTTNAPEFVKQLRRKGLNIEMEKIQFINRDNHKCWRGRYHLHPSSRQKALLMVGGA